MNLKYRIMKNLPRFSVLFLAIAVLSGACTKKSAPRTTSTYFVSATISGGSPYYSSGSNVTTTGTSGGNVKISSYVPVGTSDRQLEFYFIAYPGTVGTYPLNGVSQGAIYAGVSPEIGRSAVHGTLTLTSVTPDIIGTYNFTCTDSTLVSGSFDVPAL